jgi:hypothetical protein
MSEREPMMSKERAQDLAHREKEEEWMLSTRILLERIADTLDRMDGRERRERKERKWKRDNLDKTIKDAMEKYLNTIQEKVNEIKFPSQAGVPFVVEQPMSPSEQVYGKPTSPSDIGALMAKMMQKAMENSPGFRWKQRGPISEKVDVEDDEKYQGE